MGRDRRGLKIKLRNNLLMLTCVVSVKIHLYQFYLDAIRLFIGSVYSTRQRNPYNGYTCRRSKFEVWWFIFIDHLENPFIPAQFNAIRTLKSQNG